MPRILIAPEPREKLAELKISCDIVFVCSKQRVEIGNCGVVIALSSAFQSETVLRKSVAGMRGQKFLKFLAARFRLLGHGEKHRIIRV